MAREPLIHFLVIGGALFLVFNLWGGGAGSKRIVIGPGQIEHLAAGFSRLWQRPPTDQELKGLVDDYVREEIATREAAEMGLDLDDTIIRRRLRQKLEFLVEDVLEASPPTDEELQAWLDGHPDSFRSEPALAFRQVYVSPDRRGERVETEARNLLEELRRAGPEAPIDSLGDRLMLPQEVPLSPSSDVARLFGEDFARKLVGVELAEWAGPVESGYGLHLVLVQKRIEGLVPPLAEVREAVERDFLARRRTERLEAMYEQLLSKYTVVAEEPNPPQ